MVDWSMFARTLQHQAPGHRIPMIAAIVLGGAVHLFVLFGDWRFFLPAPRLDVTELLPVSPAPLPTVPSSYRRYEKPRREEPNVHPGCRVGNLHP